MSPSFLPVIGRKGGRKEEVQHPTDSFWVSLEGKEEGRKKDGRKERKDRNEGRKVGRKEGMHA
jgi:hypothetical protein